MADEYKIHIRTTGDASGAQEVERALGGIEKKSAEINTQDAGGLAKRVAGEAQVAGQKQAQVKAAAETTEAVEEAAKALEGAGSKAGQMAAKLAQGKSISEGLVSILTGGLNLGPAIAGAFALYKALEATNSVAQSLGEFFGEGDPRALLNESNALERIQRLLREIDAQTFEQQATSLQSLEGTIEQVRKAYRDAVTAREGLLEPFTQANAEQQEALRKQLASLEEEHRLRELSLTITTAQKGLEELRANELERATEARRKEIELQNEGIRLNTAFKQARTAGLSEDQRLGATRERIEQIQSSLQQLGVSAKDAGQAFIESIGPGKTVETQVEIKKLAVEWQGLANEERKAALARGENVVSLGIEGVQISKTVAGLRQRREALLLEIGAEETSAERKKVAIEQVRSLDQLIGKLLETQKGAPGPADPGLEKWLTDTATKAGISAEELGKVLAVLRQLYKEQANPPGAGAGPPAAPPGPTRVGNDVYNYAPPGQGVPAGTQYGGVDYAPPGQGRAPVDNGIADAIIQSGFGEMKNVSRESDAAKQAVTGMAEITAAGFRDMAQEVKRAHGQLAREIAVAKQQITALWRAV